jgi:hypothetical protein
MHDWSLVVGVEMEGEVTADAVESAGVGWRAVHMGIYVSCCARTCTENGGEGRGMGEWGRGDELPTCSFATHRC